MTCLAVALASALSMGLIFSVPAHASSDRPATPEWVKPALHYLVDAGDLNKAYFKPNDPMSRRRFGRLMKSVFGGSYSSADGKVTAGQVDAVLVETLGQQDLATSLDKISTPDGWAPKLPSSFGTEIVARTMGLRYNRPPDEEQYEASTGDAMSQADIAYAVYQAKTDGDSADAASLGDFKLANLSADARKVVGFALAQVGEPYIWGGEWMSASPSGYPYGFQPHGGVDCSGFAWYVMRHAASGWDPVDRPYAGWSLPERTSAQMAAAAPKRLRYSALKPADLVYFGPNGRRSKTSTIYHTGIYLGRGWMIDSSGSKDGVSLDYIGPGSWYAGQLAWGRRVLKN
jgi:cell wall-associated NlpC family hydrolase